MIRLLINNEEAVIEAESNIEIIRKNPFFSKEGDLTYDINLDLKSPQNAKLFGYLNRFQILNQPTGRTAALYDGPRCLIRGTEIVLSIDDSVVKIQIVGTNSELNYLTGFDMSIRDYDYGPVANPGVQYPDEESLKAYLDSMYPEAYYNYAPLFIKTTAGTYQQANEFRYYKYVDPTPNDEVPFIRQPFLLYYVEKIIELIGYNLVLNELREDPFFARLQIVTARNWKKWEDLLPDWTVDEFLSEIEKFCNCIFVVNQHNKEVSIRSINNFYRDAEIIYLDDVMDDRSVEFSEEPEELFLNYNSVRYDLPSDDLYKYSCLDSELIAKCRKYYVTDILDLSDVDAEKQYDKLEIYNVMNKDINMVIDKNADGFYWRQVDFLANKGSSEDEVELKIYPAITWPYSNSVIFDGTQAWTSAISMAPIAMDSDIITETQGMNDAIKSGLQEEKTVSNIMVSCSMGSRPVWQQDGEVWVEKEGAKVPFRSSYPVLAWYKRIMDISGYMPYSLQINGKYGMYSRLYSENVKIDTKKKVTIHFLTTEILDPKLIYQFRNKRYYCAQLKYSVENGELGQMVEGEFYPIEK